MQWAIAVVALGLVALAVYRARHEMSRRLQIAFVVAACAWTAYTVTRPPGLFSGDEGVKLVQTLAVADGQLSLTYPADVVDPSHAAFPFRPPWVVNRGHRHYGIYSTNFTAPSAIGWRLFGMWGLHLLPLLGGLLALWSTLRIAQRVFARDGWALACGAVLLTTPLVLNATMFNEHALATGMLAFAVYAAIIEPRRRDLVLAGLALGVAITIRLELVAVLPAYTVMVAMLAPGVRGAFVRLAWIAGAAALPVAIFAIAGFATIGVLTPSMDPTYLKSVQLGRDGLAPKDFTKLTHVGVTLLAWPLALSVLHLRHRVLRLVHTLALLGLLIAWLVGCARYAEIAHDKLPGRLFGHLLVATPVLAVGLTLGRTPRDATQGQRIASAMWAFAIAGSAAVTILNPVAAGLRVGDRYLLPMLPFWAIAAVAAVQRRKLLLVVAVPALALGIFTLVCNHGLMQRIRTTNADTVADVRSLGDRYVAAYLFWGPQVVAPVWPDKAVLGGEWTNSAILERIRARGETGIITVNNGKLTQPNLTRATIRTRGKRVSRYQFAPRP